MNCNRQARWARTCELQNTTVKPFEDLRSFTFHVITHVVMDWRVSEEEKKDMLHHFYTMTSNVRARLHIHQMLHLAESDAADVPNYSFRVLHYWTQLNVDSCCVCGLRLHR